MVGFEGLFRSGHFLPQKLIMSSWRPGPLQPKWGCIWRLPGPPAPLLLLQSAWTLLGPTSWTPRSSSPSSVLPALPPDH